MGQRRCRPLNLELMRSHKTASHMPRWLHRNRVEKLAGRPRGAQAENRHRCTGQQVGPHDRGDKNEVGGLQAGASPIPDNGRRRTGQGFTMEPTLPGSPTNTEAWINLGTSASPPDASQGIVMLEGVPSVAPRSANQQSGLLLLGRSTRSQRSS